MDKIYIIKIGGNIIDDEKKLSSFLQSFSVIEGRKILVHGGGKLATAVAESMGIPQQITDGRRITDAETLKVITMVYAGFINKNIVAKLQANNCNVLGLTGADGNLISAHKRKNGAVDYGYVGDIDEINTELITELLQERYSLVIAPVTHDGNGNLLNTNADTVAQEIAKALCTNFEVSLIYCFEKNGVLLNVNDNDTLIDQIDHTGFEQLKNDKKISAGMIPKLHNAFNALDAGVHNVLIGHANNISELIINRSGTAIIK